MSFPGFPRSESHCQSVSHFFNFLFLPLSPWMVVGNGSWGCPPPAQTKGMKILARTVQVQFDKRRLFIQSSCLEKKGIESPYFSVTADLYNYTLFL